MRAILDNMVMIPQCVAIYHNILNNACISSMQHVSHPFLGQ